MRERVADRMLDMLFGTPPEDRAIRWHGDPPDGRPALRIAHFGDCSWRAMDASHGVHTEPGWPLVIARELAADGVRVAFSSVAAGIFEHLPAHDPAQHLRLDGAPDVIVVQLGAQYSRRVMFEDTAWRLRAREGVGRALGERVQLGYRCLRPAIRLFGHSVIAYDGPTALGSFLEVAVDAFPGADVAVLAPYPRVHASRWQRETETRVHADMRAQARALGVAFLDCAPLLAAGGATLRCANTYNLTTRGSEIAGAYLAAWIRERVVDRAAARVA